MEEVQPGQGGCFEAPSPASRHYLEIYHYMMTTGHYLGRCSCGIEAPPTPEGRLAYQWFKKFHPEALR